MKKLILLSIYLLFIVGSLIAQTPSPRFKAVDKRIFKAALRSDVKQIEKLIREGVDVNQKNEYGETPLHLSLFDLEYKPEAVIALLKAGADINARNNSGTTPLLYALYNKNAANQYARLLIENGADVNLARDNGETPLHVTVGWTTSGISMLLLTKGADPNAVGLYGETAFLRAVLNGADIEIIRLAIEKGANLRVTNKEGKSLLTLAEEELRKRRTEIGRKKLLEIIEELKKAGAN